MRAVILGGGHAGVQLAESLRVEGWTGEVVLFERETRLPYQRPPLSKEGIASSGGPVPLRGGNFYEERDIELRLGTACVGVDPAGRTVTVAGPSGIEQVAYDELVIAIGAAARQLDCPGSGQANVRTLRTADDAEALRAELGGAERVLVIGAGFIGLEFAAVAAGLGKSVTVLDPGERVMARTVSEPTSAWFAAHHRDAGIELRLGEAVAAFESGSEGGVAITTTGARIPFDLAVAGIGVATREAELELPASLCRGGIVVDSALSAAPGIHAIGDIAVVADGGVGRRLESVQNATDQARHLAADLVSGSSRPYRELPWFWSVQGSAKLQIAGLAERDDVAVSLGDQGSGRFSVLRLRGTRLTAVESVSSPADHAVARKMLKEGPVDLGGIDLATAGVTLKTISLMLDATPTHHKSTNFS